MHIGGFMKVSHNEHGVAIIYVTLFLMVLGILFFALGVDVGWMAYIRSQGQAAVDAAALSGAAGIPNYNTTADPSKISSLVAAPNNTVLGQTLSFSTNGQICGGDSNNPQCPWTGAASQAAGVRVTKSYATPLFFSRILDPSTANTNISVSSIAWLGGVEGLQPNLPVVLCAGPIGYDPSAPSCRTPHRISMQGCDSSITNNANCNSGGNNGGWWTPQSVSASDSQCRCYVDARFGSTCSSPPPFLNIGDTINLQNGVSNDCHKDIGDSTRYGNCTESVCSGSDATAKANCTVEIPIVANCTFNGSQNVIGFAAMCITKVDSSGANGFIDGDLNCSAESSTANPGGPQFGIYPTKAVLVR